MHNIPTPYDLIEKLQDKIQSCIDESTCLIGIPSGGHLIIKEISKKLGKNLDYGLIDGSFYRDDLDISGVNIKEKTSSINFDIENKKVILIDDVFYTGRTTRAAINELFDYGRPKEILLFVLVDRMQNELPIKPSFSAYELKNDNGDYINLIDKNGILSFEVKKIEK